MSNTLAGVYNENTAIEGFSAFVDGLAPLRAFTTDFSGDVEQGTQVNTRIVPAISGTVGDLTDTHSGDYSAAIDDFTLSEVSIDMGSEPVIGWAWTDREWNNIKAGVFSDTQRRLARGHAYAIANKILDDVFATIDTTYTAALTTSAANFDADDVAALRQDWVENARNNMDEAYLVLQPSYYAALLKDNAIQDLSASGSGNLLTGELPMLSGFKVIEAPSLPGAAVNNTVGFTCHPSAKGIAMRPPKSQASEDMLAYEVMVEPVTGASLLYASWFDRDLRKVLSTFEALWGQADAVTTSLRRITSA